MAAFYTNETVSSSISAAQVLAYDKSFIVAAGQNQVLDQFVQYEEVIKAKSITLPKFQRLVPTSTPLTETDDATRATLSVSAVTITPAEFGQVVTPTNLAILQSGGKAALAAMTLAGMDCGRSQDVRAMVTMDASGNAYIANGKTNSTLLATDIANRTFMNYFYNKLARHSVQSLDGSYIAVMHDDVINDLRADTTVNASWTDVQKYSNPETVLKNEVGMFGGFRIVRQNLATVANQTGGANIDVYNTYFLGFNGLGKGVSQAPELTVTGPFDSLGRFVNIGWYGVYDYAIIDTDACWLGQCASSVGLNSTTGINASF
jgi:N4-gp56 family major capsid protein